MKDQTSASAFAPGNISCFFTVVPHEDPKCRGSKGLGFTVNEGVIVTVRRAAKESIIFNGKAVVFPTVSFVIRQLTTSPLSIAITSKLPIGSGFGISGASALATAYAINHLLGLQKTKRELGTLAHIADATERTGLGDVVNQYFGGFLLKTVSSAKFSVKEIPLIGVPVYYRVFGEYPTESVLKNNQLISRIEQSFQTASKKMKTLLEKGECTLDIILDISYEFSVRSGLLIDKKTRETIQEIRANDGHASMIVIGNAVMSSSKFPGAKKLLVSDTPAHLL